VYSFATTPIDGEKKKVKTASSTVNLERPINLQVHTWQNRPKSDTYV